MFSSVLRQIFITLAMIYSALGAFTYKPGDRFPDIKLPPITGGDEQSISALTDQKIMLHLFASW